MKYTVTNITGQLGIGQPFKNARLDFEINKKKYVLNPGDTVTLSTERLTGKLLQLRIKKLIEISTVIEKDNVVEEQPVVNPVEEAKIETQNTAVENLFAQGKKTKKSENNVFLQKK